MSFQLPPAGGGAPPPGAPPPGEDPAARFRKTEPTAAAAPASGSEPSSAASGKALPPRAHSLGRLLEETLTAPVRPVALFTQLAQEGVPGYGLLLANALVFSAAMFAVNLARVAASDPAAVARYPAHLTAVVGVTALALAAAGSFLAAALLHAAARLAGGGGGFSRSYQAVSMMSASALLWSLLGHFSSGWAVALAWSVLLACAAVERLHQAPALRTRAVFAALGLFALLGTWSAKLATQRVLAPYRMMAEQMKGIQNITQTLEKIQPVNGANPTEEPSAQAQKLLQELQRLQTVEPEAGSTNPADPSRSGLDLIKQQAPLGAGSAPMDPKQLQAVNKAAANMMQSVMPMLNNPELTKGLDPEQAKQLQGLTQMVRQLQDNLQSGKPTTPQQQQEMMRRSQEMMMQLLSRPPAPPPGKPKPAPRKEP